MKIRIRDWIEKGSPTPVTASIQKAIDRCAAGGGGLVVFESETYVTGTIYLRSHVHLLLPPGCVLLASRDLGDYNAPNAWPQNHASKAEHTNGGHLVVALEIEDAGIFGGGTIDGSGDFLARVEGPYYTDPDFVRPAQMVCLCESRGITLRDISLRNAPYWSCFVHGCEDVLLSGLRVTTSPVVRNGDGIDIDASRRVTVIGCHITTEDDCITLRCCRSKLKNREMTCEEINVSDCHLSAVHANAFRIGVGDGVIRNANFNNITIRDSWKAICIEAQYLANTPEEPGVRIENLSWSNVCFERCDHLLFLSSCAANLAHPQGIPPPIRGLSFSHLRGEMMNNAVIEASEGSVVEEILFQDLLLTVDRTPALLEKEDYGEWDFASSRALFFLAGVSHVTLEDVRVRVEDPATPFRTLVRALRSRDLRLAGTRLTLNGEEIDEPPLG